LCQISIQSEGITFHCSKENSEILARNYKCWYPSEVSLNLVGYSDSNFAGYKIDRQSTNGTCHLLGSSLISWHSKKQACVALSTAEAEYIAAGSCCAQSLWIKQ